ncbi:MAG TPA: CBS domain-containing protein [Ktedonosporobacter sp.]|nr:CBS domain-containing protein [Ktedonosporobacter sp.]
MIVRDIMATKLVTIEPDATLAHAVALLKQHRFHHLPVVRPVQLPTSTDDVHGKSRNGLTFEGLLTTTDIDLVAALARQHPAQGQQPWQERRVVEVMHRALIRVTPTTSVAAAAQILVERGLNYLPVVEYSHLEQGSQALLVGLVTRSDLLMAFARAMGTFEPGMRLDIELPMGSSVPLARTLLLAAELHVPIRSIMAAPLVGGVPSSAALRLGTINPGPLLLRLQEEGIHYSFGSSLVEGNGHV